MSAANHTISRQPLWRKVADAIEADIASGQWAGTLPGEHQLTNHYGVGRRSIRSALQRLEEYGVIGTSPGKPRQILAKAEGVTAVSVVPDHVMLISPYAEEQGIPRSRILFNRTFQELSKRGIQLVPRRVEVKTAKALNRNLGQLKEQFPRSVWLLHDCSGAVQRWCYDNGERALVLGGRDPKVSFTSVDMDAEAVIDQAIQRFEAAGHDASNIMMLMRRDPGKLNQRACDLFVEALKQRTLEKASDVKRRILLHDKANLIDLLRDRLGRSDPPTALLCWRTHDAIRAVTFLTHQGVSIPENLSVISCGSSPTMEFIHPAITRFLSPTGDYERCFLRQLIGLLEGDGASERDYRFIPEFLDGMTVTRPQLLK